MTLVTRKLMQAALLAITGSAAFGQASPVPVPAPLPQGTPFNVIGIIQEFTLDNPTDPMTRAKMVVNGITITIPKNLSVVMPGRYMTPFQIFVNHPKNVNNPNDPMNPNQADSTPPAKNKPDAALGSGLARKDPTPLGAYQADIQGNIVQTAAGTFDYRAGIVHISQLALNTASGFINDIDTAKRVMRVGGVMGNSTTGARVRLNDPAGRYGAPTSADVRFTSDDANAPIRALTGYPMCLQRPGPDDSECPSANRPALLPTLAVIRMNHTDPTVPPDGVPNCTACDARKQVPFRVGDYVIYQGILAEDADGPYISAYAVQAWLGIFTKPGTWPAYVNQEVSLIGTGGVNYPGISVEFGPGKAGTLGIINTRLKVVGFTTDPTRIVKFDRMVKNVCGGPSIPQFLANSVKEEAPLGRFRGQIDRLSFLPVPHEIRVRISPLNAIAGNPEGIPASDPAIARGLIPGIFDAPVSEYLFPENKAAGAQLVPLNLEDFAYLRGGVSTATGVSTQLSPWPGVGPWPSGTSAGSGGTPVAAPCP